MPKPLPSFRRFQLATLTGQVPAGAGWLFEMKYDGYRCEAAISGAEVRLYSRGGHDWTEQFGYVAPALSALTKGTLLIDGEICALDARGHSDFTLLKNSLDGRKPLVFFAFDLLDQDGRDIAPMTQLERKHRLQAAIGEQPANSPVQYSQHVEGEGKVVFDELCAGGFEGVVAKRAAARYYAERSTAWLKIKCVQRQEFVVIGWRPPSEKGRPVDVRGLFLASFEGGEWVYRGGVGTGFSDRDRSELREALELISGEPLAVRGLPRAEARVIRWVKPVLLAEVEFTEITSDGQVRHPSFKGIRVDKDPGDVHLEQPG